MDWFWELLDSIQKNAAYAVLQNCAVIDWIILFGVLFGAVRGGRKGFTEMFGSILKIFLISMIVLTFYNSVADYLMQLNTAIPRKLAEPFSFFMLSIFVWLSVSWTVNIIGKFLRIEAQGLLKLWGGMFLGAVYVILLASFISQLLLFLPIPDIQKAFKPGKSYVGYDIARIVPGIHKMVAKPFQKPLKTFKVHPA